MKTTKLRWTARTVLATILDTGSVIGLGIFAIATSPIGLTREEISLRAGLGLMILVGGLAYYLVPKLLLGATPWHWILRAKKDAAENADAAVFAFHSGTIFGRRLAIVSGDPSFQRFGLLGGFLGLVAVLFFLSVPIGTDDIAYRIITMGCLLAAGISQLTQLRTLRVERSHGNSSGSQLVGNLTALYLICLVIISVKLTWFVARLIFTL